MEAAIVKYNAGNIYSVESALRRLGVTPLLTDDPEVLQHSCCVLFPGQGEARGAMDYLRHRGLDKVIISLTQPVLGICIGQQLMCRHSEEGDTDCLGIFDIDVHRFIPTRHEEKIPAMGWNCLTGLSTPLFEGIAEGDYVYFVHSYHVPCCEHTIATADYIHPYSAAIHKDNFYATQFHPEKSGRVGERILENFLHIAQTWSPVHP
ncbi:MAG: imidazole glycerol phosphate synthase subunit HisH [Prevotella sp.]|nr:imidazole glycerol phosphate synthase subunit HisH [Prevotella sp.]